MKVLITAAVLAVLTLPALFQRAAAQQQTCKPRDEIVAILGEKYQESRRAYGLASPTQMLELFANTESGTWTALITRPDGVSCIVAAGTAWTEVEEAAAGPDA
jgi:hypothetical protein